MIRSAKPETIAQTQIRVIEEDIPSFSWGRHIMIGRKDLKENPAILTHERMHVRCGHSFDIMAYTVVTTLQWFNPLVWVAFILVCKDIEYACDEKVIQNMGREQKADYSQALLNCSAHPRGITACPLAFGEVSVKKRVKTVLSYRKPAFWILILGLLKLWLLNTSCLAPESLMP